MTRQVPVAEPITPTGRGTEVAPGAGVLDWAEVERRLTKGGWRWLATVRPDGAPHVMPVFGAWSESVVFVASKGAARKSRNLDADGRCVLTTDDEGVHLVVEGTASRVRDRETLTRASAAFRACPVTGMGDWLVGSGLVARRGVVTAERALEYVHR